MTVGLSDDRRVELSVFLPVLNSMVAGVPGPVARMQLALTLGDFCDRSSYWREALDSITPDGTGRVYDLEIPGNTVFSGYIRCQLGNGEPLAGDLFEMPTPRTLRFDESVTEPVGIEVSVKPTPSISRVPESIHANYCEAICNGTAARLLAMPKKPWQDPSMVAWHLSQFREGVSQARRDVQEGYRTEQTQHGLRRGGSYF